MQAQTKAVMVMAKRIRKKNIVKFDQVNQRWLIEAMIMCDTESDLPTVDEFDNYHIAQGSLAVVIDTSDRYRMSSSGTWNKDTSSGGGSATLIEKSISVNGTYNASDDDADGYSSVSVSVPNTYTAEDEGKVVDNGSLVAQTAMSTEITANDTYDTTLYNSVTVNVPQGGGSSASTKDVNFYDYDGTIVYSYTQAEFANLESMPDNPTHEGLTAQGWNWSLSDAKTYVASYKRLNIGQMYITDDGKTRLHITLTEGRTSPILTLYLYANTEVDIDWGDGTAHETLTATSGAYVSSERHNYASSGDYVIEIAVVSGSAVIQRQSTSGLGILNNGDSSNSSPNMVYLDSIRTVNIGTGITYIGNYAFYYCYSLMSITIPSSVTSIGNYTFQYCVSLSSITIPSNITGAGSAVFNACSSLVSIAIPNSLSTIRGDTFWGCMMLQSITIPQSVATISDYAFKDCYSLKSVTIPSGVRNIGSIVFNACSSLVSVTISSGVSSIGRSTFSGCYSLATITIDKEEGSISGSPWGAITSAPTSTQIVWTG